MEINTKYLGKITCAEEDIISFEEGIPGFPNSKKFIIITIDGDSSLSYLQSIEEDSVCFVITQPAAIVGQYNIEVSDALVDKIGLKSPEAACVFTILNIQDEERIMTANLQAPIIINTENKKAIQGILENSRYEIKHKLSKIEELVALSVE